MKARVKRFYWEELEEIINNLTDKISEIESSEYVSPYLVDKKRALALLLADLDKTIGGDMYD